MTTQPSNIVIYAPYIPLIQTCDYKSPCVSLERKLYKAERNLKILNNKGYSLRRIRYWRNKVQSLKTKITIFLIKEIEKEVLQKLKSDSQM